MAEPAKTNIGLDEKKKDVPAQQQQQQPQPPVAATDKSASPATATDKGASPATATDKTPVIKIGCVVCRKICSKRCSRCQTRAYCSIECQTQDWGVHKLYCLDQKVQLGSSRTIGEMENVLHVYRTMYPIAWKQFLDKTTDSQGKCFLWHLDEKGARSITLKDIEKHVWEQSFLQIKHLVDTRKPDQVVLILTDKQGHFTLQRLSLQWVVTDDKKDDKKA